jgi:hypothetical protein
MPQDCAISVKRTGTETEGAAQAFLEPITYSPKPPATPEKKDLRDNLAPFLYRTALNQPHPERNRSKD